MKHKKRLLLLMIFPTSLYAIDRENMLKRHIEMESRGEEKAVGDNGAALGILQIHKVRVDEVNRILSLSKINKRYVHQDALSKKASIEMYHIYYNYWSPRYGGEEELLIRAWNGNPKGHGTDRYWKRYKEMYE